MLEQIITASVLIVSIVLIRVLFCGRLSARVRYTLWLLVALRLLIPGSLFQVNQTPVRQVEQAVETVRYTTENRELRIINDLESGKTPEQQVLELEDRTWLEESLGGTYEIQDGVELYSKVKGEPEIGFWVKVQKDRFAALRVVWYLGMAFMALWFIGTNLVFGLRLRKTAKRTEVQAARAVYTAHIPSPCLWGRRIYVTPPCLEDETRLRHVLAHEEAHLRHGDQLWSLVRCLCLIVWWFHPLVWVAASLSRKDCELAADEGTVKRLGEGDRLAYGRTLLDIVAQRTAPGSLLRTATTMHAGAKSLKTRILRITDRRKTKWYVLVLAILLAAVAAACAFTGAKAIYGTPLNLSADLTNVDLEQETVVPGYFPRGLSDYHKEGRLATLDEVLIEFYSPSPDTAVFPEPGYWRESDGVLYFRLSKDWGCIVTGGDVPTEELVKLVESFYVVQGPEPAMDADLEERHPWGVDMSVVALTTTGVIVRFDADDSVLPKLQVEAYYWPQYWEQGQPVTPQPQKWKRVQEQTDADGNTVWFLEWSDTGIDQETENWSIGVQVYNPEAGETKTFYMDVMRQELPADEWGLYLHVIQASPTGLTFRFDRDGTSPDLHLRIDRAYWLEQNVQGQWIAMEPVERSNVQQQLSEGSSYARNLIWEGAYGVLSAGEYRLGMQVCDMDTEVYRTYYAPFRVFAEDHGKTLNYEKVLRSMDPDGLGYSIELYLPEQDVRETLFTMNSEHLFAAKRVMESCLWSPWELGTQEAAEQKCVTISANHGTASMSFVDYGTVCQLILDDGNAVTHWMGEPLEQNQYGSGIVQAMRQIYDGLAIDYKNVRFSYDGGADGAARYFAETAYGEHLMGQAPGSVYDATDYELLNYELHEVGEDGTYAIGSFSASFTPELGEESFWWDADYFSRFFCVQKQADGLWQCVEMGTGGATAPKTVN